MNFTTDWVMKQSRKGKPEMREPFSIITQYNRHMLYSVHSLFNILDDIETNRDSYYDAICNSKTGRYFIKPAALISDMNTGETTIDYLRWYAYLEDWPFYIERFKTQIYRKKDSRKTKAQLKNHTRVINTITLNTRPLSWFGVPVVGAARCLQKAMNSARAEYKRIENANVCSSNESILSRIYAVDVELATGKHTWYDKSKNPIDIITLTYSMLESTPSTCQTISTLNSWVGTTELSPSTTTSAATAEPKSP